MFGLPKEIAGTIIAAIIAAVISLLGLLISKENKVSEFRQAWIDALREEIAEVITHAHSFTALTWRSSPLSQSCGRTSRMTSST